MFMISTLINRNAFMWLPLLGWLFFWPLSVQASQNMSPESGQSLIDESGLLTPYDQQIIINLLSSLPQTSERKLVVLVVPDTGEESLESYAARVSSIWESSHSGKDNASLLLLIDNKKQLGYIETGNIVTPRNGRAFRYNTQYAFHSSRLAENIAKGIYLTAQLDLTASSPYIRGAKISLPASKTTPSPAATSEEQMPIPELVQQLTDMTGLIDTQEKDDMPHILSSLEEVIKHKIFVLITPTTGALSIEQYAARVFDDGKLGPDVSNKILLLIDPEKREGYIKMRESTNISNTSSKFINTKYRFYDSRLITGTYVGIRTLTSLIIMARNPTTLLPVPNAIPSTLPQMSVPNITQPFTDITGLITSQEQADILNAQADWERRTGYKITTLVIPTAGTESLEQYNNRIFAQWKLKPEDKDNAILMTISWKDSAAHIMVGNNLKIMLDNALDATAVNTLTPHDFHKYGLAENVRRGVNLTGELIEKILLQNQATTQKIAPQTDAPAVPALSQPTSFKDKLPMLLLIISVLVVVRFALTWVSRRYFTSK